MTRRPAGPGHGPFALLGLALVALLTPLQIFPQAIEKRPVLADVKDLVIFPYCWPRGDQAMFDEIRDCGFNCAGFVPYKYIKNAENAGLKVIAGTYPNPQFVTSTEIAAEVASWKSQFEPSLSVLGYYLADEPRQDQFQTLAKWNDAVAASSPQELRYINLPPNIENPKDLSATSYEDYLKEYIARFRPNLLSYDNYMLMSSGNFQDYYFRNLEIMRALALANGIPFWNTVLSNAHKHYIEPSETSLRLQLFSSLAYGAKGICWFTYFAPAGGAFRAAPIDQFGNKTPTWEMLRKVNYQANVLAAAYGKLKSINVFHYPLVPKGCKGISSAKLVSTLNGGQLIVGEFLDADATPYALVVNNSFSDSIRIQVKFKTAGSIRMINGVTGESEPWTGDDDWLAPGQGILLFLANDKTN